jgi:hypothetical protein
MQISRLCGCHEPSRPIQELDQNLLKRHKQQSASSQHARLHAQSHSRDQRHGIASRLRHGRTGGGIISGQEPRGLARPSLSAHVPTVMKSVGAAAKAEEQKGLFDIIFGPMV